MNLDWHMQRDGENMTIEDFIKSLTYEQKVGLIWALFYDACEMSKINGRYNVLSNGSTSADVCNRKRLELNNYEYS